MTKRIPTFFPQRLSVAVPGQLRYAMDVHGAAPFTANFGAPIALNSTGILAAQSINAAVDTTTFAAALTASSADLTLGKWGRALRVVASGAATSTVDVYGRDYLGQRMRETATLNGATPVLMLKAFKYIDRVVAGITAATTIDLGWRDCFGLPYKAQLLMAELKNDVVAANAGTFVAGLATATAATATNADVRGTHLFVTVLPNGTNTFELMLKLDKDNLHGNAQFFS